MAPGHGEAGKHTVDLTYWVMFNEAGDHCMIWARIEMAPDGRTFFGSIFAEIMKADGSVSDELRCSVMGIRLSVEPFPPGALPATSTPTS